MNYTLLITIFGGVLGTAWGDSVFSNPILEKSPGFDHDDTIYHSGGSYYLVGVDNRRTDTPSHIVIRQSPVLTDFNNATKTIPRKVPDGDALFSPVMQKVNGSLYLYYNRFHGDMGPWRMYVIKADDPNNPMGSWSSPEPLFKPDGEKYEIDGTVMEHNGQLYWIGTEVRSIFDPVLNLGVFKMKSPMEINEPGAVIREGSEEWECSVTGEGGCGIRKPFVIYNKGVSYVVYSARPTDEYSSLSYISIAEGQDPMNITNWKGPPGPVFSANGAENVFHVETASFTDSPDGRETWMVYHATFAVGNYEGTTPRIEQIRWNSITGEPEFPAAHGYNNEQPVPSGQSSKVL